ncbi:MAG: YfiR family protein [Planctomycetota bacterium]|nr:YfiR family protein [Planctomycetota bacterium]
MLYLSLRLRRCLGLACLAGLLSLVVGWAVAPREVFARTSDPSPADAQVDDKARTKEYTLKAAFIFNFLKYTTWPKDTFDKEDEPIILGVVGEDAYGDLLDKVLANKQVEKRAVIVRRFAEIGDVKGVHALLVGKLTSKERTALYARLGSSAVLVVGDEKGMAGEHTCVASFFLDGGKVRFEVSTNAIKRTGLTLSSQLLKLADVVEKRK